MTDMIKVIGKPDFEDKLGPKCHKPAPADSVKNSDNLLKCVWMADHKLDQEYPHMAATVIDNEVTWYAWR